MRRPRSHVAASTKMGVLFCGAPYIARALLLGIYIRVPDFESSHVSQGVCWGLVSAIIPSLGHDVDVMSLSHGSCNRRKVSGLIWGASKFRVVVG